MFFCSGKLTGLFTVVTALGLMASPHVQALDKNEEALAMVSSAMDAYSNLEMDRAKDMLEGALDLGDELESSTRAKIHTSLGVVSISGFSDTPIGQTHFIQAACLDGEIKVDALYSTPEIDLVFSQAKEMATPEKCRELGIVLEGAGPSTRPCGDFSPMERQRRSYEIPFYLEVSGDLRYKVASMVLHYSFDSGRYTDLDLAPRANGYGAKVECDLHEIRRADPREVTYYIEGFTADGELVCGQGDAEYPLTLEMADDAPPPSRIAGMKPEACVRCEEGDAACQRKLMERLRGNAKEGDSCTSDMNCKVDLMCDPEMFVCTSEPIEREEEEEEGALPGHKKFYVALTGGTGGGFVKKSIKIKKAAFPEPNSGENYDPRKLIGVPYDIDDASGEIVTVNNDAKGFSWSGIPVRLAVGVHITPKLSVEVSGRMDMFLVSNSTPVNCWDAAGGNVDQLKVDAGNGLCSFDFDGDYSNEQVEEMGKVAISMKKIGDEPTDGTNRKRLAVLKTKYQFSWLVNARARYRFLNRGSFVGSVFGGVGYGHIQYRVKDKASGKFYFPMPGMVNIELGPGLAYYFSKNVGLVLDVPLDFIVGDGFAFNIDVNLGVSLGF